MVWYVRLQFFTVWTSSNIPQKPKNQQVSRSPTISNICSIRHVGNVSDDNLFPVFRNSKIQLFCLKKKNAKRAWTTSVTKAKHGIHTFLFNISSVISFWYRKLVWHFHGLHFAAVGSWYQLDFRLVIDTLLWIFYCIGTDTPLPNLYRLLRDGIIYSRYV